MGITGSSSCSYEDGGSTRFASFIHFFSCFEEGFGWERNAS